MTTKDKILEAALFLFNRFGFVSVRLQHIADEGKMSVGNLAYHYKTKDDIVESLYGQLAEAQQQLLADLRMIPLFINMNRHAENSFLLQKQYSFFYTDTLEVIRAHSGIKRKYREQLQWQIMQLEMLLTFNVARGALLTPTAPDSTALLANRYVVLLENWMNFERMKGTELTDINAGQLKQQLWGLLAPYFSPSGLQEYQQLNALPFDNWS